MDSPLRAVISDPLSLNAFNQFLHETEPDHLPYLDFCHAAGRWDRKRPDLSKAEEEALRTETFAKYIGPAGDLAAVDPPLPGTEISAEVCHSLRNGEALIAHHATVLQALEAVHIATFWASEVGVALNAKQEQIEAMAAEWMDELLLDAMGLNYLAQYIRRCEPSREGLVMFCVDFKRLKKRARDPESYERMRIKLVEDVRKDEVLIALVPDAQQLEEEELLVRTNAEAFSGIAGVAVQFLESEEGQTFAQQKQDESEIERQAQEASFEAASREVTSVDLTQEDDPWEEMSLDSFRVAKVLGKGSYGTVLHVQHKQTNQAYALKVMAKGKMSAADAKRVFMREKAVLNAIGSHPFVVSCRQAFATPEKFYLVLDFCSGGDLDYQLSLTRTGTFDEARTVFYAAELTLALEHLHNNCVLYRDLKPENVLVDHEGHIKLTDFGISRTVVTSQEDSTPGQKVAPGLLSVVGQEANELEAAGAAGEAQGSRRRPAAFTFCGSPAYLSPEMVAKRGHGYEVDWFGMGALIFEMMVGLPPFYSDNLNLMLRDIRWREPRIPSKLGANGKSVISGLLKKNPAERLTAVQMKEHAFFESIDWEELYHRRVQPPYVPEVKKKSTMEKFRNFFSSEK